jgi:hypothetical protein
MLSGVWILLRQNRRGAKQQRSRDCDQRHDECNKHPEHKGHHTRHMTVEILVMIAPVQLHKVPTIGR